MEKLVWALASIFSLPGAFSEALFEDGCVNQSRSDSAQDKLGFINEKSFTEKTDVVAV